MFTREIQRFWTTQTGMVIYPCQMNDRHLLNTINFIEKRVDNWAEFSHSHDTAEVFLYKEMKVYRMMLQEAFNRGIMPYREIMSVTVKEDKTPYKNILDRINDGMYTSMGDFKRDILSEYGEPNDDNSRQVIEIFTDTGNLNNLVDILNKFQDFIFESSRPSK